MRLRTAKSKKAPSRAMRNVTFSIIALVLFIAILEITLRLVSFLGAVDIPRERTCRDAWAREGWAVDKDLNWALLHDNTSLRGGVSCRTNSHGLRDQEIPLAKPDGTFRILVIGDSTVLSFAVPFEKTFCEVLERMLNEKSDGVRFDVINAGVPGYSIYNCFVYLKRDGIRFDPDMIVLETNFNDRRYVLSEEFQDGEEYYHDFYYRLRLKEILNSSYLYRGLRRILVDVSGLSRGDFLAADEFDYKHIDMENLHCRIEPERYRELLHELIDYSHERDIPVIIIPLEDPPLYVDDIRRVRSLTGAGNLKDAYAVFTRMERFPFYRIIVTKMVNEILAAHGRHHKIIKTIPVQIEWMGTDGNVPVYLSDPYVAIMEEAGRDRGVLVVGLDSLTIRREELYVDYIHLNEKGHRLLAEELFMELNTSQEVRIPLRENDIDRNR